jgi:hypothetical protein
MIQNSHGKLILAGIIIAILTTVFLCSVALIDERSIKEQIDTNISYKSLSIKKLPYPQVYIQDISFGDVKIKSAKVRFPLLSILLFSHKLQDLELENVTFSTKNEILSFQDFHLMLQNIWFKKESFSNIDLKQVEISLANNQILKIPYVNFSCASSQCFINNSDLNLRISEDKDNIIAISGIYSLMDYKINFEEKYDIKTKNFLGGFLINQISDMKGKIQGEIVGSKDVTHFRNIASDVPLLKGVADYAIFHGKGSNFKSNIDYAQLEPQGLKNLIFALKSYSQNLFVDIKIASGKIGGEKLSDVKILANSSDNMLNITNLVGNFESDNNFNFVGKLDSSLEGKINFTHSDVNRLISRWLYHPAVKENNTSDPKEIKIQFSSDIYISDKNYNFRNINSKISDKININGQYGVRFISDTPRVISCLEIDSFDFNDNNYPIIDDLFSYVASIASGMKSESYLSRLDVIKNLGYKLHPDLYFTNAQIGDHKISTIHADVRVKDSHVEVKKLDIVGDDLHFSAEGELQAWGIKPLCFININGTKIQNLNYNFNSITSYLSNNIDFKKVQFNLIIAIDQFISNDNLNIQNIRASLKSDDAGGVKISNLIFDIFGGRVTSTSYFTLNDLSLEGVFGYNNFLLDPIISYLGKQDSILTGVASANGRFKANLENYTKFLKELDLSGNYLAKFINIQNFGIDDYIDQITKKDYDAKSRLEYDTYYAPLKGNTEIPLLSGAMDIQDGLLSIKDMNFTTKFSSANLSGSIKLDGLTANNDLKVDFEFIIPEATNSDKMLNKVSDQQNAKFSMKIQDYIFSPVRVLDVGEMKSKLFGSP